MALRAQLVRRVQAAWLVAAVMAATPGLAQSPRDGLTPDLAQPRALPRPPEPPSDLPNSNSKPPKASADRERGLDFLLGALQAAPDEASAKHVEARIWALWSQTSSDTAALLMARSKVAIANGQPELALKLLDAVVKLKPDYIEGWNRRATLYYVQNDYDRALRDIEQVLTREPRHFGALAGLGMIMQELGDDKRALSAYRKALAVNPHLDRVPELVKKLTEKVEGRDI